jgi:hypothetical protein
MEHKAKSRLAKAKDTMGEKQIDLILGVQAKADAIAAQAIIMIKEEVLTIDMPHASVLRWRVFDKLGLVRERTITSSTPVASSLAEPPCVVQRVLAVS